MTTKGIRRERCHPPRRFTQSSGYDNQTSAEGGVVVLSLSMASAAIQGVSDEPVTGWRTRFKFLHPEQQVTDASGQLNDIIERLIVEGVRSGQLRDDVHPAELASYCVHAVTGAAVLNRGRDQAKKLRDSLGPRHELITVRRA
jgi:hypothetical protein